ncbi:MAG TPA: sodium:solute symporter family protein [Bacillota bacterium]|nr:sodium:solute symporter family protein [Bacillota bacterium]
MTNVFVLSVFTFILYTGILFGLSAFFVKRALNSYEEYTLCGRTLTIWYVILTYMGTWIGGGTIIGLAGSSYMNGVGQYWIFASSCVAGYFFAMLFITRIRAIRLSSIGDMFALRFPEFGEKVRIPVSVGLLIRNVTMIGMQFTALSFMFTYLWNIDRNLAVLVTFIIITGYTAMSGLWAVVATDVFQGFLQTIGLFVLMYFSIAANGGIENIVRFYAEAGKEIQIALIGGEGWFANFVLCFITFGLFFFMGDQSDWERVWASKNDKTAFWGYLIPLTVTLLLLLIPTYIGVFQKPVAAPGTEEEYLIYGFVFERLSPILALFITVTIISAIMSSADSFMIGSGQIFSNDIIKRFVNREASDKELIFWTRMGVVVSGTVGFAFAINISDMIYLWISGIAIATVTIIPAYFMAWFSKTANTRGVLWGMGAGMLYCALILLLGFEFNLLSIFIGLVINQAISFIVSRVTGCPSVQVVGSTYYWSERFRQISNIPK